MPGLSHAQGLPGPRQRQIAIRTRDMRIHLDRPGFALNPTSCEPKAIETSLHSTEGATKLDSERFQVGGQVIGTPRGTSAPDVNSTLT